MDSIRAGTDLAGFINVVKERYAPTDVILFGSRARGEQGRWSDYDIIVVSDKFSGIKWLDRRKALLRLWSLEADADLIPYTPEEFADKRINSSVIRSAVREGKRIQLD